MGTAGFKSNTKTNITMIFFTKQIYKINFKKTHDFCHVFSTFMELLLCIIISIYHVLHKNYS